MVKKIRKNYILCAVLFLTFIFVFGAMADRNLYRFKRYGETNANYEFEDDSDAKSVGIQTEYAVHFPFKVNLIDLNGLIRRWAGEREMNGVIKLNNGYLTETSQPAGEEQINADIDAVAQYAAYCRGLGIRVIYVQPPYKISKYDPQLPDGVSDGHNESLDKLLDGLKQKEVEVLDLRAQMFMEGINQYDLFYKTDHHWTTEGGFYAYQKIAERIASDTGTDVDPMLLDIHHYQIDNYPQWHLGSRGQRTGALFAGIDDYHLIYPAFETHIYNESDQSVKSLKDALIKMEVFSDRSLQSRYTYDFAYAKCDINELRSLDAKTDLNVLLLSDSYQEAMKAYMLLTYKEFHIGNYWRLSTSVVNQYHPDVIVIMPYGGNVGEPNSAMIFDPDDSE